MWMFISMVLTGESQCKEQWVWWDQRAIGSWIVCADFSWSNLTSRLAKYPVWAKKFLVKGIWALTLATATTTMLNAYHIYYRL